MQYAMPTATQTKTKVKVHEAALVGISAVCTAALLGAFTANFAIATLSLGGGFQIAATPTNLLPNPSFETGAPDPTSNWWGDYRPYRVTVTKNTYFKHSGLASASVKPVSSYQDANGNNGGGLYKRFTIGSNGIEAGATYRLSAWLRADKYEVFKTLSVCAQYYSDVTKNWKIDCNGTMTDSNNVVITSIPSTTWFQSALEFTTTKDFAASQDVIVYVGYGFGSVNDWKNGEFKIDDVKLVKVALPTLSVGASSSVTAQDIPNDTDQALVGGFDFTAGVEPTAITFMPLTLRVTPIQVTPGSYENIGSGDIENISIYDEQGQIVAGPIGAPTPLVGQNGALDFTVPLSDQFTVPVGTHQYKVKADIGRLVSQGTTIQVILRPNQITARGAVSNRPLTPTPATEVTSALMTVKDAILDVSVSSQPPGRNVAPGSSQWEFANIILDAIASGQDIRVTQINVRMESTSPAYPAVTYGWKIYDGTTELVTSANPDVSVTEVVTPGSGVTASFAFVEPLILSRGTAKTLTIKGNISSDAYAGTIAVGMPSASGNEHVRAVGVLSGADAKITMHPSAGQSQTIVLPPLFRSYITYPVYASSVGIGDFNNDGRNDVAIAPSGVVIMYQNEQGTLTRGAGYAVGRRPSTMAVGDVSGDGLDDIITGNNDDDTISILVQLPGGGFAPASNRTTLDSPYGVVVGDFNNDQRNDIAVSHWRPGKIKVFTQSEDGTVDAGQLYDAPRAGWDDLVAGDLDGDGRADIIKMNGQGFGNPTLSVLYQAAMGGFETTQSYPLLYNALGSGIAVGDVAGDSRPDVLVSYTDSLAAGKVEIFNRDASGGLVKVVTKTAYNAPQNIRLADVDGDQRLDIIVYHHGWNKISVYPTRYYTGVSRYVLYATPSSQNWGPNAMAVGDINNDGLIDVVAVDTATGLAVLLHN